MSGKPVDMRALLEDLRQYLVRHAIGGDECDGAPIICEVDGKDQCGICQALSVIARIDEALRADTIAREEAKDAAPVPYPTTCEKCGCVHDA